MESPTSPHKASAGPRQTAPGRLGGYAPPSAVVGRSYGPPGQTPSREPSAGSSVSAANFVKAEPVESPAASVQWPWNHPVPLVLYFDPFSVEAKKLADKLESKASKLGCTLPRTTYAHEATHIVLDPECELNNVFRSGLPGQVVSLDWLKQSYFEMESAPEQDYPVKPLAQAHQPADLASDRHRTDAEADQAYPPRLDGTLYVTGKATAHGWLLSEEDSLARFLAALPKWQEVTADTFDRYAETHHERTARAYEQHYRYRRAQVDHQVATIRAEINGEDPPRWEEPEDEEMDPSGLDLSADERHHAEEMAHEIDAQEESDSTFDGEMSDGAEDDESRGPRAALPPFSGRNGAYSQEEQRTIIRLLKQKHDTLTTIFDTFQRRYPHRTAHAANQHYYNHRAYYDQESGRSQSKSKSAVMAPSASTRPPYSEKEKRYFVMLLRGNSVEKAARLFSREFPNRSAKSAQGQYYKYQAMYKQRMAERDPDMDTDSSEDDAPPPAAGGKVGAFASSWTEEENEELIRLRARYVVKSEAYRQFSRKYPGRTLGAIAEHVRQNEAQWQPKIDALKRQAAPGSSDHHRRVSEPEPAGPSSKRSRMDDDIISSSYRPRQSLPSAPTSSYRPENLDRQNAVASGSGTSAYYRHAPARSASSSLSPGPVPLGLRAIAHRPYGINNATTVLSPPRAAAPLNRSPSVSPAPLPLPASSPPPSAPEPAAFAFPNVPPQGHPPHLPFCCFCGHADSPVESFSQLTLAAADQSHPDPEMRTVVVEVPPRTACRNCRALYHARVKEDDEDEEEMGGTELERLGRVTRAVVLQGLEKRAMRVRVG